MLLNELEEKHSAALKRLEDENNAKREEVKRRMEEERSKILDTAKKEALELSQKERIQVIGAAKLQAKKIGFDATEKMLEANVWSLRQALSEYAGSKEYSQLLPQMVRYASKRLGGEVSVSCRAEDSPAIKKAGAKVSSADLTTIGGFKAQSEDGDLELDLTFEELLRTHEEEVRAAIIGKE
jgi:vacuolar-type H+-ATPase subunit E/Vma4